MPNVIRCHHCGCNSLEVKFEFGSSTTYACNHCGRDTVGESEHRKYMRLPEVEYQVTCCPVCESGETVTVRGPQNSADGAIYRHHKCTKCGCKFRSKQTEKAN